MSYLYFFILAFFIMTCPAGANGLPQPDFSHIFIPPQCDTSASKIVTAYPPLSQGKTLNRYGQAYIDDQSLQILLLKKGMAVFYPKPEYQNDNNIKHMTVAENYARSQGKGCVWNKKNKLLYHADNIQKTGQFMVVEGKVLDVYKSRNNTYLNFGSDWKTDFTVRVRNSEKSFKSFDLDSLADKKIRVRGYVSSYNGPSLTLTHPVYLKVITDHDTTDSK